MHLRHVKKEVTPLELRRDIWLQKTRVPELSYDVSVILRLAVLVQYRRVTDGQTHDDSIYRASIASRGKNMIRPSDMLAFFFPDLL